MKKYNEKKETMSTWSWHREELQNLFTFLVSLPRNYEITIFVDAFDECQSEKEARELVLYFMRLVSAAAPGERQTPYLLIKSASSQFSRS